LIIFVLMATTCLTTEAALQTGLLPAQERREGRFAKVSSRLKTFQTAFAKFKPVAPAQAGLVWYFCYTVHILPCSRVVLHQTLNLFKQKSAFPYWLLPW